MIRRPFTCIACGRSGVKKSREDIVSEWLREYAYSLGGPFVSTYKGRTYAGPRPKRIIHLGTCEDCNSFFGRRIEQPAKDTLISLIEGHPKSLSTEAQLVLARWFAWKALSIHLTYESRPVPVAMYRSFRVTLDPPPGIRIWLGAYGEPGIIARLTPNAAQRQPYPELPPMRLRLNLLITPIIIGSLVAQVFQTVADPISGSRFASAAERLGLVIPLWPRASAILTWPPERYIDSEGAGILSLVIPT
jgi:hypothetical protein